MQDELRITLFLIGAAFIIGILLHGVWTIRKNKKLNQVNSFQASRALEPKFDSKRQETGHLRDGEMDETFDEDSIYDDVGVGQARVISNSGSAPADAFVSSDDISDEAIDESRLSEDLTDDVDAIKDDLSIDDVPSINDPVSSSLINEALDSDLMSNTETESTTPVYSGVVTQPKPEFDKSSRIQDVDIREEEIPEPPGFLLKTSEQELADATSEQSDVEQDPKPDFSLDVQDGPVKERPVEESPVKESPANDNPVKDGPIKEAPEVANESVAGVEKELSFAEQAKRFVTRRKKTVAEKIRKEPKASAKNKQNVDQMRMDFEPATSDAPEIESDAPKLDQSSTSQSVGQAADTTTDKQGEAPTDVLVLNVKASSEKPISGAALLPMLLTLGFKFGEHDIFHRHVNTNGKGPILFSLTNMFKPGVFDIDNLENFTTQGVSLFMMLPIEGDAQQVFNMMHNAARKVAEEFDCKVLDGNKVLLSKQSLQQYSERIRTFERKQHAK